MYYQKGAQRIEIFVRRDSGMLEQRGAKEKDSDSPSANGSESTDNNTGTTKAMSAHTKKLIRVNVTHALSTVRMVAQLRINYHMTGLGYANGDQNYQDVWQRRYEVMQDYTGVATSTIMGVMYGASGGVIGMSVGAILGTVKGLSSTLIKYDYRQRDFDVKVFKENNAIEYNRTRASMNWTNGRLR